MKSNNKCVEAIRKSQGYYGQQQWANPHWTISTANRKFQAFIIRNIKVNVVAILASNLTSFANSRARAFLIQYKTSLFQGYRAAL
jgi:hypothetical protein